MKCSCPSSLGAAFHVSESHSPLDAASSVRSNLRGRGRTCSQPWRIFGLPGSLFPRARVRHLLPSCQRLHLWLLSWLPSRLWFLLPFQLCFQPSRACFLTRPLPQPNCVSGCNLIVRLDFSRFPCGPCWSRLPGVPGPVLNAVARLVPGPIPGPRLPPGPVPGSRLPPSPSPGPCLPLAWLLLPVRNRLGHRPN